MSYVPYNSDVPDDDEAPEVLLNDGRYIAIIYYVTLLTPLLQESDSKSDDSMADSGMFFHHIYSNPVNYHGL